MTNTAAEMGKSSSGFDFHQGEVLVGIVASKYPTLLEVIFEEVQNAIDADATNIHIRINHKTRNLKVEDDGCGTSKSKFEMALTSVAQSIKSEDKLGRWGIGLISPLGKCERFTFASAPKSDPKKFIQWMFDTEVIRRQKKVESIPFEELRGMHFERVPSGKGGGVPWRTQVNIFNFTKDKQLSKVSLSSIREGILERFSIAMHRLGTKIRVTIVSTENVPETDEFVANKYDGRKLAEMYINDPDAGQSTFRIYIARKTVKGRNGKVCFGVSGNDYRINLKQLVGCSGGYLDAEVIKALSSGTFEGEILSEKAMLNSDRKRFDFNDSLVGFCATIKEWYQNHGEKHFSEMQEEIKDARYQTLGLRSMSVIEEMLSLPKFDYLRLVIDSFRIGTIGTHHATPTGKVMGPQDTPSVSTGGKVNGKAKGDEISTPKKKDPETEHLGHTPFSILGPKGSKRIQVRGNSLGLQFSYEEMAGESKLWDIDSKFGIIRFNTRHPLWAQCESDEKVLMQLQEYIALQALHLETIPNDRKSFCRAHVDDSLESYIFLITRGDEISGRKPGSALNNYNKNKKAKKA